MENMVTDNIHQNQDRELVVLDNGLKVVLIHKPNLESVGIVAVCGAGSRCDPPKFPGIAHLVEHLLYRSNLAGPESNICRTVYELGGETNGMTDISSTSFMIYMHRWDYKIAIDSLAEIICDLPDSPDVFQLEKSIVLEELELVGESNKNDFMNIVFDEMFKNNELRHTPGGTKKAIKKIRYQEAKEFYEQWYTGGNIVVAIAGNFDKEQVVELIKSKFSSILPEKKQLTKAERIRKGKRYRITYVPIPMSYISITYPCIDMQSTQLCYLALLENIFCNGPQSRLYRLLREEEGLAYVVDSDAHLAPDFGLLTIFCATKAKNCHRVVNYILSESERLITEGISEVEFERAKKMCLRRSLLTKDNPTALAHWYAIQELHSDNKNPNTLSELIDELETADIDKANRIAKGIFSANRSFSIITGGLSVVGRFRVKKALKKYTKQAKLREKQSVS